MNPFHTSINSILISLLLTTLLSTISFSTTLPISPSITSQGPDPIPRITSQPLTHTNSIPTSHPNTPHISPNPNHDESTKSPNYHQDNDQILNMAEGFTDDNVIIPKPFVEISFAHPSPTLPTLIWYGIAPNPFRLEQMQSLHLEVFVERPGYRVDSASWSQQSRAVIFDLPQSLHVTHKHNFQWQEVSTSKLKSEVNLDLWGGEEAGTIPPPFIGLQIEFTPTWQLFWGETELSTLCTFQVNLSSSVPDKTEDDGNIVFTWLTSRHEVFYGVQAREVMPRSNTKTIPTPVGRVNLVLPDPSEPFIGPNVNPLIPQLRPSVGNINYLQWSVDVPWNSHLGGGNDEEADTLLGLVFPHVIQLTTSGPFSFAINKTRVRGAQELTYYDNNYNYYNDNDCNDNNGNNHCCVNNHHDINTNTNNHHDINTNTNNHHDINTNTNPFSTYPMTIPVSMSITCYLNHFQIPAALLMSRDISHGGVVSSHLYAQVIVGQDAWPSHFLTSLYSTQFTHDHSAPFTPQGRFGSFNFHCGEELLLYAPLINQFEATEGNIGTHLLNLIISTASVLPIARSTSFALFPENTTTNLLQRSYRAPYFPSPVLYTTQSLFNSTTPNEFFLFRPPFIIPVAPITIAPITSSPIGNNQLNIPVQVTVSLLVDVRTYHSQSKQHNEPFFSLSLAEHDQITTSIADYDKNSTVYIYYERIGNDFVKKELKDNSTTKPLYYETQTTWYNSTTTQPFSLPPQQNDDNNDNTFQFNNNVNQYYKMMIIIPLMVPNLFHDQNKDILFSNQIQLNHHPSYTAPCVIHKVYFPLEKWLLDLKHHLSHSTNVKINENDQLHYQLLQQDQLHEQEQTSSHSQLTTTMMPLQRIPEDNRTKSLPFNVTTWDMITMKTDSINLIFKQTHPDSAFQEQIDSVTIHLVGSYRFQFTSSNGSRNNDGEDGSQDEAFFHPYRPSLVPSSQSLPIITKCLSIHPTECSPVDILVTASAISFKLNFTHPMSPDSLSLKQIQISIDPSVLNIVRWDSINALELPSHWPSQDEKTGEFTMGERSHGMNLRQEEKRETPEQQQQQQPLIGKSRPTPPPPPILEKTSLSLIAHVEFSRTSTDPETKGETPRQYSQVVNFGLVFKHQQPADQVLSAFGTKTITTSNSRSFLFILIISILSVGLVVALFLIFLVCRSLRRDQRRQLFARSNPQNAASGATDLDDFIEDSSHNQFNQSLLSRIEQESSVLKDEMTSFVTGIVKTLDEYQPPTYHDLVGDNVEELPGYDHEMEGVKLANREQHPPEHMIDVALTNSSTVSASTTSLARARSASLASGTQSYHNTTTSTTHYTGVIATTIVVDDSPVPYESIDSIFSSTTTTIQFGVDLDSSQ